MEVVESLGDRTAPVVAQGDDAGDALCVEDLDDVSGHALPRVGTEVRGLGGPAVAQAVGGDDTVAVRDEVFVYEAGPESSSVGPAVEEDDGGLGAVGWGGVVCIGEAAGDLDGLLCEL